MGVLKSTNEVYKVFKSLSIYISLEGIKDGLFKYELNFLISSLGAVRK